MIKEFFGTPIEPFKRNTLELLKHQQDILDILLIHAKQGGFSLVVGKPGTGKSVLRKAIEKIGAPAARAAGSPWRTPGAAPRS